jgi:hypothetical protein
LDREPKISQDSAPGSHKQAAGDAPGAFERWLDAHLNAVAILVIAAGFAVRLYVAARSYLNPDEALHYLLINQPSAFLAYKASLTNAHPPLLFLLLYFWHFVGSSELMLRLPSVLAGTAACWFIFKWIRMVFGKAASLVGVVAFTFCPALIALSAQVREYSLLLFGISAALYFLEQSFQEESVSGMWCFAAFLYVAILTHYSAVFFTAAIGIYALARIADSRLPRKVIVAWAAGQVGAVAIYGILYLTHVSKVKKENLAMWSNPFDQSYFHAGGDDLLTFTREHTAAIFLFLFQQKYISQAMLLAFVVGIVILLGRELISRRKDDRPSRSSHSGILLLLPFIAVWCAAIAGVYPYVGSRHTVFLAPFAIAAVSYLLAALYGQKLWAGLLIAVLVFGASNTAAETFEPFIRKEDQSRALMLDAMNYIHQSIPRSDLILVDYQSSFAISYYLCGPKQIVQVKPSHDQFSGFNCDGYSIVTTDFHIWKLGSARFPSEFEKLVRAYGLKPGDRVWVFQNGWGSNLDVDLPWRLPKFQCLTPKLFGANLSIIPFIVGPDMSAATPEKTCAPPAFNSVL